MTWISPPKIVHCAQSPAVLIGNYFTIKFSKMLDKERRV